MRYMEALPQEIEHYILSYLPAGYLPFMRTVAKRYLWLPNEPVVYDLVSDNQLFEWYNPQLSIDHAVELGNLEVLKWAYGLGALWQNNPVKSASGHLNILKWLEGIMSLHGHHHQAKTPEIYLFLGGLGHPDDYEWFIANQNFVMIEWLLENGTPMEPPVLLDLETIKRFDTHDLEYDILNSASDSEGLDIVKYIWETQGILPHTAIGTLDRIKWLHELKVPIDSYAMTAAAERGDLEAMSWLIGKCPLGITASEAAVNVETLKWLVEHGCPVSEYLLDRAIDIDHIQLGISIGIQPTDWTFCAAVHYGRIDTVKWLLTMKSFTANHQQIHSVEMLFTLGIRSEYYKAAIRLGSIEYLRELAEIFPLSTACLDYAFQVRMPAMEWLLDRFPKHLVISKLEHEIDSVDIIVLDDRIFLDSLMEQHKRLSFELYSESFFHIPGRLAPWYVKKRFRIKFDFLISNHFFTAR